MNCRHCGADLTHTFIDLGHAPPSNAYRTAGDLNKPETYYPLKVKVCHHCWLVQTEDYASANELFSADYAYFSSTSRTWLQHAADYSAMIVNRLGLDSGAMVVEVASNDGYLLRNFVQRGIPCLGIEPTASTAGAAEKQGILVLREFFGSKLADRLVREGKSADLIIGNNVLAHVPDINDFAHGLCAMLKPGGTVTMEFPHLLELIAHVQFDTIYHEHFSYLSLAVVSRVFEQAGLRVFDVDQLPTHGGSLRVYGCRRNDPRQVEPAVNNILDLEEKSGLQTLEPYRTFQASAERVKNDLLLFLIEQKRAGKTVAAYGAAAKGNTILNYAGVKPDLIAYVCDAAAAKQGKFLPGSHIPILHPEQLFVHPPDYVLILPWNIAEEVRRQLSDLSASGTRFVTAIPNMAVLQG